MGSERRTWNMFLNGVMGWLMLLSSGGGGRVLCYQYKVGDLDAWNIPSSSNPNLYTFWANHHNLTIGDSLLFLYPPSQDSVMQVTWQSYNTCNIQDPILLMNNGNSLFNITKDGVFYFTSGVAGHCQKHQKLRISVGGNGNGNGSSSDPAAPSPSYPTVFGSIPMSPSSPLTSSSDAAAATSSFLGTSSSWLLMSAATCLSTLMI